MRTIQALFIQTPTGGYEPLVFNLIDALEAYRVDNVFSKF